MPDTSPGKNYLEAYTQYLATERRLSPHTTLNYSRDIEALLGLVADTPLTELQAHHIRRYVATLHGRGLNGKSLARMLSAWRGFFKFLIRNYGIKHNPCAGMRPPKSAKALPQVLSPDETAQLLHIPEGDALTSRDKAIFELFYSSGLRLTELVQLQLSDINFGDGTVQVIGKGNKTRIVPVGNMALEALKGWLALRAGWPVDPDSQTVLFVGKNGKGLTQRAIQYRLKALALRQGLNRHVHPHMLRHSFASHVLQSSGDLRAVQEMLGHASIASTQIYTHLDFQYLAKIYDAAHPRAKKKA